MRQHATEELEPNDGPLDLETDDDDNAGEPKFTTKSRQKQQRSADARAASRELQIHELVALASCFIFPLVGTWLLHATRSKLSRPSEGLVSNYNLSIFLLASEIRPFSHLLKMVQARTLHLQRIVALAPDDDGAKIDARRVQDLSKRLEELEAHVAEAAAARMSPDISGSKEQASSLAQEQDEEAVQSLVSQAISEVRKTFQPEIDALNRAVRRYEKRTAVTAFQTESRLQELSTQAQDAIALAAAAQRSSERRRSSFAFTLLDWICAVIVVPAQLMASVVRFFAWTAAWCWGMFRSLFWTPKPRSSKPPPSRTNTGKLPQRRGTGSPRRLHKVSSGSQESPELRRSKKAIYEIYE